METLYFLFLIFYGVALLVNFAKGIADEPYCKKPDVLVGYILVPTYFIGFYLTKLFKVRL